MNKMATQGKGDSESELSPRPDRGTEKRGLVRSAPGREWEGQRESVFNICLSQLVLHEWMGICSSYVELFQSTAFSHVKLPPVREFRAKCPSQTERGISASGTASNWANPTWREMIAPSHRQVRAANRGRPLKSDDQSSITVWATQSGITRRQPQNGYGIGLYVRSKPSAPLHRRFGCPRRSDVPREMDPAEPDPGLRRAYGISRPH